MNEKYIFIDFEFTTFEKKEKPNGFFHEIIEAGLVVYDGKEIIDSYSSLVKPHFFPALSDKVTELTGIKQDDLEQAVEFSSMIEEIKKRYTSKKTMLVTWGDMDVHILRKNCKARKVKFPFSLMLEDWIDLSKAYQYFYGYDKTPGLWNTLKKHNLTTEEKQSHRALDDAIATLSIYKKMKEDKWIYSIPHEPMQSSISDLINPTILEKLKSLRK